MRDFLQRILLSITFLLLTAGNAIAENEAGKEGAELAQNLYCNTADLLEGNIGLLLGLILVFMGIWALIQGAKMIAVVPMIIVGSLVTALPSVIESSFKGLGTLLKDAEISTVEYKPPTCPAPPPTPATTTPTVEQYTKLYEVQKGVYYPGRGVYNVPPLVPKNSSGSPDDRDED